MAQSDWLLTGQDFPVLPTAMPNFYAIRKWQLGEKARSR
jgi:hypothetical protein